MNGGIYTSQTLFELVCLALITSKLFDIFYILKIGKWVSNKITLSTFSSFSSFGSTSTYIWTGKRTSLQGLSSFGLLHTFRRKHHTLFAHFQWVQCLIIEMHKSFYTINANKQHVSKILLTELWKDIKKKKKRKKTQWRHFSKVAKFT